MVKTASEFRSSLENHKNRTFTEVEHLRAEKIRKLDGDTLRLNYHGGHDHSGLLNAKLDDLHQFLDSIMTK
nr:protein MIS12 homolog [Ipomoea batatas]